MSGRLGILVLVTALTAQVRVGEWKAYTSTLKIAQLVEGDGQLYMATTGGLLVFDLDKQEFSTLTRSEGLLGTHLAAIRRDSRGYLWLGGVGPYGFIQVFDPQERKSRAEFDTFELQAVYALAVQDSSAYGVIKQEGEWGLIEFTRQEDGFRYRDIYRHWPLAFDTVTGIGLSEREVFVATDAGLLVADRLQDDLKQPSSWKLPYPALGPNITRLRRQGEEFLILSDQDVYSLLPGRSPALELLASPGVELEDLTRAGNTLVGVGGGVLYRLNPLAIQWELEAGVRFTTLLALPDGRIAAGTSAGVAFWDPTGGARQRFRPNTLPSVDITSLEVLDDGRLVAGSPSGLAVKEVSGWRNIINAGVTGARRDHDYRYFAADTIDVRIGDRIADLEQGPDGLLYCALAGERDGGILILDVDQPWDYQLVDTSRLDHSPSGELIVSDLEFDPQGNLWIAVAYATAAPLTVRTREGVWRSFTREESDYNLSLTTSSLGLDFWGRLWIGAFESGVNTGGGGGLAVLNYGEDPLDPADHSWISFTVHPDHSDQTVWALAITPDRVLALLTPLGLRLMELQPGADDPIRRRDANTYFPQVAFGPGSRVKSDPRGNLWALSSTQGVQVRLENGTFWPDLNGFRTATSPLLSDRVFDLAFDHRQGLAYLATGLGINTLRIPFREPLRSYQDLEVFPSPFHLPSERPLVVDGLMDHSTVVIMTPTGRVVRDLGTAPVSGGGYQAFWDGRGTNGRWVSSGVYLIAVYSPGGDSRIAKVAVIRH